MKIDVHLHVNHKGLSPKRLIAYLNKNNIDACWLLTWEEMNTPRWPYKSLPVEDVYRTYQTYPDRIIPMYAPDPRRQDSVEVLMKWHKLGFKGCAELKTTLNWNSDKITKLLSAVSKLRMPVLFHMQEREEYIAPFDKGNLFENLIVKMMRTVRFFGLSRILIRLLTLLYPPLERWKHDRLFTFPGYLLDFDSLENVLKSFPSINFVGHGPLFWKAISKDYHNENAFYPKGPIHKEGIMCKLLDTYDNLYADISGGGGFNAISRDVNFSKYFFSKFNKKILFGTDNCALNQAQFINSLGLPRYILNNTLGENAKGLLAE